MVKSNASVAVKWGVAIIGNAKQMYEYCTSSLVKDVVQGQCTHFRRDFYLVESDDIVRDRERCQVKTITGTRSLHSIQSADDYWEGILKKLITSDGYRSMSR